MALINTNILLRIADRVAFQFKILEEACCAMQQQGLGFYFDEITKSNDADVEIPLGYVYRQIDLISFIEKVVKSSGLSAVIYAMDNHFNLVGSRGGWDGYLATHDVRVSYSFAKLLRLTTGSYLLANNVFSEEEKVFANLKVLENNLEFIDGVSHGNGNVFNPANGIYYAPTQLAVKVVSMGTSNLDINLTVKNKFNNPTLVDVTIPGGSPPGSMLEIGTNTDRFLDVIGANYIVNGSQGTFNDSVEIISLKERQIEL